MFKNTIALLLVSSTKGRAPSLKAEENIQPDDFDSYEPSLYANKFFVEEPARVEVPAKVLSQSASNLDVEHAIDGERNSQYINSAITQFDNSFVQLDSIPACNSHAC